MIIKNSDSEGDSKVNIKNTIDFKKTSLEKDLTLENSIFVDQITDEEASNLFANIIIRLMGLYSDKILNMNFVDVTGNEEEGRETVSFGKTTADTLLPGQTFDDPDAPEVEENDPEENENQSEVPTVTVTEEPRPEEQPPQSEHPEESETQQQPTENNTDTNSDNGTTGNENSNVNVSTISKADVKSVLEKQIETMKQDARNNNREFTIKDLSNLPTRIEDFNVSSIITEDKATIKIAGYTFYMNKDLVPTEE